MYVILKNLAWVLLTLLVMNVYSQHDTLSSSKNIIKFTPFKIVNLSNPGVEFSYERTTGRKFSTEISTTYLLTSLMQETIKVDSHNEGGFGLAIQEKYYFIKDAPVGLYFALEMNYINTKYGKISSFGLTDLYPPDTTYIDNSYSDTISIHKQTYSINLKFGFQKLFNRFTVDVYAGIGARYKDVIHHDRIDPKDPATNTRHPNFYYYRDEEGKNWRISIPLNVRLGYRF